MREQKPRGHNWSSQGLVTNKERTKPKLFKIFFSICLFLAHWVSVAAHALSLVAESRVYSSVAGAELLIVMASLAEHKL